LSFIACAAYGPDRKTPVLDAVGNALVEGAALVAAAKNTDFDLKNCATMGEKLVVRPGADIIIGIVVRDPSGTNYSPYSFPNPSLLQVGITQPLNEPELDHIDLIRGMVTSLPKQPTDPDYAGTWPNTWLTNPDFSTVPAAAKNTTAAVIKTFSGSGSMHWKEVRSRDAEGKFLVMTYRIPAVSQSQYVRLRGTNMPPGVPFETDANGNPLPDVNTNTTTTLPAGCTTNCTAQGTLRIPCTTTSGSNVPENGVPYPADSDPIDACPNHLPSINGTKYVAYDVAAWSDLWFYSNPIYVQVDKSTMIAGVN